MRVIGKVSENECREIEIINEKIFALKNLMKIIDCNLSKTLYNRCIEDYNFQMDKFNNWWSNAQKKYKWEVSENDYINIKFQSGEIFIDEQGM